MDLRYLDYKKIVTWAAMSASIASGVLAARSARAQTEESVSPQEQKKRNDARRAYASGTQAYRLSNFAGAYDHFKAANDLIPTPHAQYWMAQCSDVLGMSDLALAAYEQFLNNPSASKAGEDKLSHARERYAKLKAELDAEQEAYAPPSADAAPAAAPSAAAEAPRTHQPVAPEPAPEESDDPYGAEETGADGTTAADVSSADAAMPTGFLDRFKPARGLIELGAFGGVLAVSNSHELREAGSTHRDYKIPAAAFGARAAYFPSQHLGLELEYARGQGKVDNPGANSGSSAVFNSIRAHVIGQLANSRLVPFGLLGAGALNAISDDMGSDTDPLFFAGLGVKLAIIDLLTARLDLRADLTEGKDSDMTVSGEALLGLSATLGR